ncbi:FkbM family methyltransferase [Saccharolobus shibatae]|uniref:Methyltransferase FkbM domain-containing protein n=1 Tax=Saccharolobus shibatae TaxID=2286 RepID=A0A8F5BUR2_9CREN|nr:FkbM family methyltransferase [Saccharolobus shibatae]QXJ31863.1 hypothetical protein J5U21_01514 [Saccharolobus shibatae]
MLKETLSKINVYMDWFLTLKKAYKNYLKVACDLLSNEEETEVILRLNNDKFVWPKLYVKNYAIAINSRFLPDANPIFNVKDNFMEFTINGRRFRIYGFLSNGHIYNEFIDFEYKKLNFKNKVVIDIGANIGDTAIYFAINGARMVYAIEPMPKLFEYLTKNIEYNHINNIIPLNFVISNNENIIKLPNIDVGLDASINSFKDGSVSVKSKRLKTLIEEYGLDNIALKIDCEGCEYDAIFSLDYITFKKIDQIMLEYHYGYYELVRYLTEKGFKVEYTNHKKYKNLRIGFLYAFR